MKEHKKLSERQFLVYKELPLPEETGEQRKKNMQLFCDNLELILANSELILKTPEYFHIRHEWSLVGGIYLGSKYIPLGVLIKLWMNDQWLDECPECGGKTYIYCAGGSPLSGSHYTNAVCTTCKKFVDQRKSSGLAVLIKPAFDLCNTFIQKRKILRTKGPVFSWSKGMVGEAIPDRVIEDVVQPVKLKLMIDKLKNS